MRKLLSTAYSDGAFNFAMLVQRVVTGLLLLIGHGLDQDLPFQGTVGEFLRSLTRRPPQFAHPGDPGGIILFHVPCTGFIHPNCCIYYCGQFFNCSFHF